MENVTIGVEAYQKTLMRLKTTEQGFGVHKTRFWVMAFI